MIRHFKPGDRVQLKSGGPVMEVIKYVQQGKRLGKSTVSNAKVLCVWFESGGNRKEEVIHQNRLIKRRLPQSMINVKAPMRQPFG
ncbi:MAG: DUF2158 domain-containing protein [Cytophagales bacterium]|nr:DUF2158 domain-containing protein [Cytophagales bacterium]